MQTKALITKTGGRKVREQGTAGTGRLQVVRSNSSMGQEGISACTVLCSSQEAVSVVPHAVYTHSEKTAPVPSYVIQPTGNFNGAKGHPLHSWCLGRFDLPTI